MNQLSAIAEYISLASPVYAEQVVERIGFRLRQAQMFPESGRRVPEAGNTEMRELLKTPYRMHPLYRAGTGNWESGTGKRTHSALSSFGVSQTLQAIANLGHLRLQLSIGILPQIDELAIVSGSLDAVPACLV